MKLALCFPTTDPAPAVVWNTFRSSQSPLCWQGPIWRPLLQDLPGPGLLLWVLSPCHPSLSVLYVSLLPSQTRLIYCLHSPQITAW